MLNEVKKSRSFEFKIQDPSSFLTPIPGNKFKNNRAFDKDKIKLEDAKRQKQELERRLDYINQDVKMLNQINKTNNKTEERYNDPTEFIKRLKEEKKERRKRILEEQKALEEKRNKKTEEFNKKLKEKEEELLKQRKEDLIKSYELSKKRKEENKKFKEDQKLKPFIKSDDYLYKRLETNYKKDILTPMLIDKKQKLADRRNIYKPLDREELNDHMKKIDQLLLSQKEERKKFIQVTSLL